MHVEESIYFCNNFRNRDVGDKFYKNTGNEHGTNIYGDYTSRNHAFMY